jgi:hypothetical protein
MQASRDLSDLVVAQAGRVVAMDDAWEPYRLVDADGVAVESVAAYLRDLQAAARSAATARSHALDLLRWFRFLWVVEIGSSGSSPPGRWSSTACGECLTA